MQTQRRFIPSLLSLAFAAALPAPSFAGDGVLEISQACVSLGCFPGDGPGFPVTPGKNR